ncbi:GAF domain-containing sensor histidine kinase, partial [Nitrolancea hollandica]|uniref:GAF domain-containing sensor histidine kinase n=1 Tax=Nitrolancea hollandica TaxID=1206749 RepID=UPI0015652BDB
LIGTLTSILLPLTLGVAIFRYRLFAIDMVLNRALVYGALTACVIGLYVLLVDSISSLFRIGNNTLISLAATALVAVLFQPLRERLQRGVNRIFYGERDDPYAALSRLGQRLEGTLAPDAVLPAIVTTVTETLNVPYAAIILQDGTQPAAVSGTPAGTPLRLPLVYQGEPAGELLVAPRAADESFSSADLRLLEDLTRQAGVAVHAVQLYARTVQLATDLQHSRERLITAREEERRRLRRDLHDGLGPQLASLTLKLETARNRLGADPVADALLTDLTTQTRAAIADIRRLVYALRPPALDELGLVFALRESAAQYSGDSGLHITVEAPAHLPPLPAAVEVAAFRIAQEAMTNVARHAMARSAILSLTLDDTAGALCLELRDDGRGIAPDHGIGVGLASMRERAEELGGTWSIEPVPTGGTRIVARLPYRLPGVPDAKHPEPILNQSEAS